MVAQPYHHLIRPPAFDLFCFNSTIAYKIKMHKSEMLYSTEKQVTFLIK